MAQGVVADNWSLQDISDLFLGGMDDSRASEIIIKNDAHSYKDVSFASIQTEALFDFLTDIILRDEILVDQEFQYAWSNKNSPILIAEEKGIVRGFSFLSNSEQLDKPRSRIVEYMCSTESLHHAHEANSLYWKKTGEVSEPVLSATLWGGAGMCARSFVYEKSYTPHPLRKRFFINSGFMLPAGDALHQVTSFLNDERVKVSKKLYGTDSLYSSSVNMPALPIRVIQESSSPEQLINVAIEMRNEFQSLRDWLKVFQNYLGSDNFKGINQCRRELDSISSYINSKIGLGSVKNPLTMEAGLGIFKLKLESDPINYLKNQFGVRATLNRLILGANGKQEMRKFIKMFDQAGTSVGYEIEKNFS